jgi:hypothetical protein
LLFEGVAYAILWLYYIFLSIPKWLKPEAGGFSNNWWMNFAPRAYNILGTTSDSSL